MTERSILLVDDDVDLREALTEQLSLYDEFAITQEESASAGIQSARNSHVDLLIMDVGLPDMDGLQVLAQIRQSPEHIAVMVLTARDGMEDKIAGLDRGADDYLAKPFDMQELAARLRVFERRLATAVTSTIVVGNVRLDTSAHTVHVADEPVILARREYMLLKTLMESAGKVLTRGSLENRLYSWGEEVSSNAIEVHIHHLRKKLGNDFIKTIRGVGYKLDAGQV